MEMRITHLFVLVVATTTNTDLTGANPADEPCTGPSAHDACANDYPCRTGEKNYASTAVFTAKMTSTLPWFRNGAGDSLHGDEYCDCEEYLATPGGGFGMTGEGCSVMFRVCPDESVCFHGADCRRENGGEGGGGEGGGGYSCDCKAETVYPSDAAFVGSMCEYEVTGYCQAPYGFDPKDFFCANGGACPANHWDECSCPPEYAGPNCEFLAEDLPHCPLPCANGGTCFFGEAPSTSPYVTLTTLPSPTTTTTPSHCKCPDGFTGPACETPVTICGPRRHYCLSEGVCVGDEEGYGCDCARSAEKRFDGEFCEHATTFCGDEEGSYCMHDGMCGESGCVCPRGYSGKSCEVVAGGLDSRAYVIAEDVMWIYLGILFLGTMTILVLIFINIRRSNTDSEAIRSDDPMEDLPEREVNYDVQIT